VHKKAACGHHERQTAPRRTQIVEIEALDEIALRDQADSISTHIDHSLSIHCDAQKGRTVATQRAKSLCPPNQNKASRH
jgi:hypothetical protein